MKAVILAGGRGTRLSEETLLKPKPLVEAAGKPLLWHIMSNYALYGITEFIVLVGYKGNLIKEYFHNFWMNQTDITFDLSSPDRMILKSSGLTWKVTVLDSGMDTQTAGRLNYLRGFVGEKFLLTYGDGVSDVNISDLISSHDASQASVTLTAVQPPARFGALSLKNNQIIGFQEKPAGDGLWINGGHMVVDSKILETTHELNSSFEFDVLPKLAEAGQLNAYFHTGNFIAVDTIRDLGRLEELIHSKAFRWI
jgi:glucose-1-phosphate cytidylyltransferase